MKNLFKNLFKKNEETKLDTVDVIETVDKIDNVNYSQKTKEELVIQEIHDEFDSAQDRLLQQSSDLLKELNIETESSIEKQAERLKNIGFINTPTVKKASQITQKREEVIEKVVNTKEQAQKINHYKIKYPFLKFLTEDELNRICDKYGLIHAPVANFIKEVPDKNIKDIENAQPLKNEDNPQNVFTFKVIEFWTDVSSEIKQFFSEEIVIPQSLLGSIHKNRPSESIARNLLNFYNVKSSYTGYIFREAEFNEQNKIGLFIAAPPSDFDLTNLKKKTKKGFFETKTTIIKDPIVFRYVDKGLQVLTKWGLEAEDPMLVLPINN